MPLVPPVTTAVNPLREKRDATEVDMVICDYSINHDHLCGNGRSGRDSYLSTPRNDNAHIHVQAD